MSSFPGNLGSKTIGKAVETSGSSSQMGSIYSVNSASPEALDRTLDAPPINQEVTQQPQLKAKTISEKVKLFFETHPKLKGGISLSLGAIGILPALAWGALGTLIEGLSYFVYLETGAWEKGQQEKSDWNKRIGHERRAFPTPAEHGSAKAEAEAAIELLYWYAPLTSCYRAMKNGINAFSSQSPQTSERTSLEKLLIESVKQFYEDEYVGLRLRMLRRSDESI